MIELTTLKLVSICLICFALGLNVANLIDILMRGGKK